MDFSCNNGGVAELEYLCHGWRVFVNMGYLTVGVVPLFVSSFCDGCLHA